MLKKNLKKKLLCISFPSYSDLWIHNLIKIDVE